MTRSSPARHGPTRGQRAGPRRAAAAPRASRPAGPARQPAGPGRHAAGRSAATRAIVGGGAVLCAAGLTGLALASAGGQRGTPPGQVSAAAVPAGRIPALPDPAAPRPVASPRVLVIPAIGVRTRLIRLGRTARGALQVPATTAIAGWYTGSPAPGAIGSSVIAGHVDSYRGPGVFFRLRLLRPGNRIYVRRADGTLAEFRVSAVALYRKARFPSAAVYGPVPEPELRLVTCGGTFDPGRGSYLSNVVVYAVAVPPGASRRQGR